MTGDARPTLVVLGAFGQVGRALAALPPPPGWRVRLAARPEIDITRRAELDALLQDVQTGLVVNAAAYTKVEQAESEVAAAFAVNRDGAGNAAAAAAARGLPILHISTDFVFDGRKSGAYDETDAPLPLSVYGASKLAGEVAVAAVNPRHLILRTAWVFSAHAACFPRAIFRKLAKQPEVQVVDDEVGCPTAAEHIAEIIVALAPGLAMRAAGDPAFGLFHLGGLPVVSRLIFAEAVAAESRRQGIGLVGNLVPCRSSFFAGGVQRPANSALSSAKFTAIHRLPAPDWRSILPACVKTYGETA